MSGWQVVERAAREPLGHALLAAGEPYGDDTVPAGEWAQVIGDLSDGALVLVGSRPDILARLREAIGDVDDSYRAEHENGYHLRHPSPECPECCPSEILCPACGQTDDRSGWFAGFDPDDDRVRCGNCRHVWDAFAASRAAGVLS